MQALCRATEVAFLGDCDEVAQVSQFHGANLPASRIADLEPGSGGGIHQELHPAACSQLLEALFDAVAEGAVSTQPVVS